MRLHLRFVKILLFSYIVEALQTEGLPRCVVPRYAPYLYIKNITSTKIIIGITDPNDPDKVSGYHLYFWAFREGINSTILREDRDFGYRNFTRVKSNTDGTYVLSGLLRGFNYCSDITAYNECGHGPYCVSCFENARLA